MTGPAVRPEAALLAAVVAEGVERQVEAAGAAPLGIHRLASHLQLHLSSLPLCSLVAALGRVLWPFVAAVLLSLAISALQLLQTSWWPEARLGSGLKQSSDCMTPHLWHRIS